MAGWNERTSEPREESCGESRESSSGTDSVVSSRGESWNPGKYPRPASKGVLESAQKSYLKVREWTPRKSSRDRPPVLGFLERRESSSKPGPFLARESSRVIESPRARESSECTAFGTRTPRESSRLLESPRSRVLKSHRESSRVLGNPGPGPCTTFETPRESWRVLESPRESSRVLESPRKPRTVHHSSRVLESPRESSKVLESPRES